MRAIMGTASILAIALAGAAHGRDDGADGDVEGADRIVVTGTAVETAQGEMLQSAAVVTLEEAMEAFDGSLGASLERLPGIATTSFGPAVGRPIIRGLGGDRVRILSGGVGLVDASQASSDHATTSEVLDAERIDILRGPAAIAYGGGAIGGVINVVDGRVPSGPIDGAADGQVYAGATSVDRGYQLAGRARSGVGPLVLQLEGSHREADDFDIPGFAESARLRALEAEEPGGGEAHEEAFGTVPNSGFDFDTLGGGASIVGDWGFLGLSARDYDAVYGLPGHGHHEEEGEEPPGGELEEEGEPRIVMKQMRYDLRGEIAFPYGPFDHADVSAATADYEHAELESSGEVGTLFQSEGWEVRAALVNGGRGERWSGSVGVSASATDFSAEGEEAFVPPVETRGAGVFVAQRLDLGGYGFEGGLRFETRDLEPSGAPGRGFDTWSAALGGFLQPADGMFLGASLTRTERAPADVELYSNGPHAATGSFELGEPTLGVETGLALDLTFRLARGAWLVEAGGFASAFDDFIYLAPTGEQIEGLPVFRYLHDDATLWGGELFVSREVASFGPWALVGDATLEYVRGETKSFGDLPRMPPFSATLGVGLEREIVDLRGEVVYAAAQDEVAADELPTDEHTFLNLAATTRPFGEDVRVVVEALNVTDEEGRRHTSQLKDLIPLPGRSLRLGVLATF